MEPDDYEPPLAQWPPAPPPAPPEELEERVIASLRARGMLRGAGAGVRPWARRLAAGLAAAVLVAVGYAAGSRFPVPAPGTGERYLLLLYQTEQGQLGAAERDSVVDEYRRWAARLGEEQRFVMGEELGEGEAIVGVNASGPAPSAGRFSLGGFFVIEAEDMAEAVEIARTTPHARRGGTVVVRPISPT